MVHINTDVIYYNGNIITMNDKQKIVEAVAVTGDKIIAVGKLGELRELADQNTEFRDLKGKTLLPGFIDAHSHIFETALRALWVDVNSVPLGTVECIDDLLDLLRKKAVDTPEGQWIIGWGFDDSKVREMRHITRDDLDKVSIKHPISISHISGWVTYHNTMALEKGNIINTLQNTEYYHIVRDTVGKATGVIEAALCPVMSKIPLVTDENFITGLRIVSYEYLKNGCTTAQEGWWCVPKHLQLTQKAIDENQVAIRFVLYPVGEGDVYNDLDKFYPQLVAGEYIDDEKMLCMGAIKLTADGSPQARTARLSKPYYICPEDKPDYLGPYNHEQAWLNERVLEIHKQGKQIAIHCNGDGAIEMVLNAFEYAQEKYYRNDPRFIFIHCQTVRSDQLKRIAKLKATASFFVTHTYFWGERHRNIFLGPERAMRISPLREAMNLGINCSIHNDTYVTPISPLLSVWSAVNRQTYEGNDLGKKEQGITVYEALKTITINAAIQGFEEKLKGSIEQGKLADFVVLDENPLEVDEQTIKDIQVCATIIGNKIVYGSI